MNSISSAYHHRQQANDPPHEIDLTTYLDASRIQALKHFFGIPGQQGMDLF